MDNLQTIADVIIELLRENLILATLLVIIATPVVAAVCIQIVWMIIDFIVYGIFRSPRPQEKSKPAPPERPADEKDMIRQISVNFMARRGTSPEYAIERAEEMVDALKKKGLLR